MLKWSTVDNSAYIVNHFKNPSGGRLQLSYMADGFSILVEWSFVSLCHHSQKLMWRQTYWSTVCLCFILQWWSIGNCFEYFKAQGASKKVSTWVLEGKTPPRGVGQRLKGWKLGRGGATILINTMPALWDKNNGFARGCYIILSFIIISQQGCRCGWFTEGETNWSLYYMSLEQCWLWYNYISNYSHHISRGWTSSKVGLQVTWGHISWTQLWLKHLFN